MSEYKFIKHLAFECSPLMSGGFVRDLIGTNKPGAKWAEAAAQAVARGSMGDEIMYSFEAVKEDARAHGFDEEEAITNAIWAAILVMQDDFNYLDGRFVSAD